MARVWIAFADREDSRDMVDTGLSGFVDSAGDLIIPFKDDTTAEEVARILTGTIARETTTSETARLWARIHRLRQAICWYDDALSGEYGGKGGDHERIERMDVEDGITGLQPGDMTENIQPVMEED